MEALTVALTEKFTQRMEEQLANQAAHYEERFRSLAGDFVGMSEPEVTAGRASQDVGSPAHITPHHQQVEHKVTIYCILLTINKSI